IEIVRDGRYEITLMYVCPAADVGATVQVEIGSQSIQATITKAHNPDPIPSPDRVMRKEVFEKVWAPLTMGAVTLKKGKTRLVVRALAKPGQHVMDLKAVHVKKI
ncbi:MAG: hypothetical protein IID32_11670, partial [Planctomycetes bacterium]|nr:hypothetical protein [Planctomycetota bacterium]